MKIKIDLNDIVVMRMGKIFLMSVLMGLFISSCKIQEAPGAYLPAQGKIVVDDLAPEPVPVADVVPTPDRVVRPEDPDSGVHVEEFVKEPVLVEEPVVKPLPSEVLVSPVKEKEVTRAEKFDLVEGQTSVILKNYHVVIGSFGMKTNALNLQSQMRPQYNPILVVNENGLFRVLLDSYDTYNEARNKINQIKSQFPDAWILIQKR